MDAFSEFRTQHFSSAPSKDAFAEFRPTSSNEDAFREFRITTPTLHYDDPFAEFRPSQQPSRQDAFSEFRATPTSMGRDEFAEFRSPEFHMPRALKRLFGHRRQRCVSLPYTTCDEWSTDAYAGVKRPSRLRTFPPRTICSSPSPFRPHPRKRQKYTCSCTRRVSSSRRRVSVRVRCAVSISRLPCWYVSPLFAGEVTDGVPLQPDAYAAVKDGKLSITLHKCTTPVDAGVHNIAVH